MLTASNRSSDLEVGLENIYMERLKSGIKDFHDIVLQNAGYVNVKHGVMIPNTNAFLTLPITPE